MTAQLAAVMLPFWTFCGGLVLGIYGPQLAGWYERRQEARWEAMRAALPPTAIYPRRIIDFRGPDV